MYGSFLIRNFMLSVIIPSCKDIYLQRTIEDVLKKANGKIEVIAVLDGADVEVPKRNDPRIKIVHIGKAKGMRNAINAGIKGHMYIISNF